MFHQKPADCGWETVHMCVDEAGVGLHTSIRKSGWICGMRFHQWGRSGHGHPGKNWQFIWHSWRAIGSAIESWYSNCLQRNHRHSPASPGEKNLFQDLADPHVCPQREAKTLWNADDFWRKTWYGWHSWHGIPFSGSRMAEVEIMDRRFWSTLELPARFQALRRDLPKSFDRLGKNRWKTRGMSMAELRSPWCSRSING